MIRRDKKGQVSAENGSFYFWSGMQRRIKMDPVRNATLILQYPIGQEVFRIILIERRVGQIGAAAELNLHFGAQNHHRPVSEIAAFKNHLRVQSLNGYRSLKLKTVENNRIIRSLDPDIPIIDSIGQ